MRSPIWVAFPDSILSDDRSLSEKTIKVGQIARACSIFRVPRILIFHDHLIGSGNEADLIRLLLEYCNTPQYLRRKVYPITEPLKYAGRLPPIQSPHHTSYISVSDMPDGDYRMGFVEGRKVDVGTDIPVALLGDAKPGSVVTVRMRRRGESLIGEVVKDEKDVPEYWGYKVFLHSSFNRMISESSPDLIIITSRLGRPLAKIQGYLANRLKGSKKTLLVFGSPKRGLYDILRGEGLDPEKVGANSVNFVPEQGVATVRSEEALFISLGIINFILASGNV